MRRHQPRPFPFVLLALAFPSAEATLPLRFPRLVSSAFATVVPSLSPSSSFPSPPSPHSLGGPSPGPPHAYLLDTSWGVLRVALSRGWFSPAPCVACLLPLWGHLLRLFLFPLCGMAVCGYMSRTSVVCRCPLSALGPSSPGLLGSPMAPCWLQ